MKTLTLCAIALLLFSCSKKDTSEVKNDKTLEVTISGLASGVTYDLEVGSGDGSEKVLDIKNASEKKTYTIQTASRKYVLINAHFRNGDKGANGTILAKVDDSILYSHTGSGGSIVTIIP